MHTDKPAHEADRAELNGTAFYDRPLPLTSGYEDYIFERNRAETPLQGVPALVVVLTTACVVGIISIILRSYALSIYSPLPAGFSGPIFFRVNYLLHNHAFAPHGIRSFSYWSNGVNTQLGFYLLEVIYAGIQVLSQNLSITSSLVNQILLSAGLELVAVLLLIKNYQYRVSLFHIIMVTCLVTMGTPIVLVFLTGWDEAYGWLMLLTFTLVAVSGISNWAKSLLTLGFIVVTPLIYHTSGFLLMIYTVILWILSRRSSERSFVAGPTAVIVLYTAYQIYVSIEFFGALGKGIVDVLTLSFLNRDPIHYAVALHKLAIGPIDLKYVNLAIWLLLAIPTLAVMRRFTHWAFPGSALVAWLTRGVNRDRSSADSTEMMYTTAVTALTLAVFFLGVLFGFKFSFEFLVNRSASYFILPAALAVITEIRYSRAANQYVIPVMMAAIALSIASFSVQAQTSTSGNNVTWSESSGYTWLAPRLRPSDVVFTDFRLSGPFIADGHLRVVGISGNSREDTLGLLSSIYYHSSAKSVTKAIDQLRTYHDGDTATYLFLSTLMFQSYPGLTGYGIQFPTPPVHMFQVLAESGDWQLVFQNAEVRIYHRVLRQSRVQGPRG